MPDAPRRRRWRDFQKRVIFSPGNVYRHRSHAWTYLPVHPFGDEAELLTRLGMRAEDCWSADAWWGILGDATLVESCIARRSQHSAGHYAWRAGDETGRIGLLAVLDSPYVSRTAFEASLTRFAALGFPAGQRFRLSRAAGVVKLDKN